MYLQYWWSNKTLYVIYTIEKTDVFNDPLGQTQLTQNQIFIFNWTLFCFLRVWKSGDWRTDKRTGWYMWKQERCHQWSNWPDPQSRQLWTLFLLEICFVLLDLEKWGRTDNMCDNNDHYRPWLWVGRVDQYFLLTLTRVGFEPFFSLNKTRLESLIQFTSCGNMSSLFKVTSGRSSEAMTVRQA